MTVGTNRVAAELMSDPADIAELVATVIALPNTAAIAELLVNCRLEDMV
jgi:NADP-dependent 3-hydroxy acid dehydrogenase YdfG